MDNLCFFQQENIVCELPPSLLKDTVVFETCLRKIYFFDEDEALKEQMKALGIRFSEGPEALQILLEILCGLRSKILGETEIFGQFKNFLDSDKAQKILWLRNKECQRFLFEAVKETRDKHIKEWGVQSYGSLIRKLAKPYDNVSLIGFGNLAQELVPWLKKKNLTIHVRRPESVDHELLKEFEHYRVVSLSDNIEYSPLTIVAAPLVSSQLLCQAGNTVKKYIDCRALSRELISLRGFASAEVIELQDLFSQLESEQKRVLDKVPRVQAWLAEQVQKFNLRASHRPLGWEDLCA